MTNEEWGKRYYLLREINIRGCKMYEERIEWLKKIKHSCEKRRKKIIKNQKFPGRIAKILFSSSFLKIPDLKGAEGLFPYLRSKWRVEAAFYIQLLNDFRGLGPILKVLETENNPTAALNMVECALFLSFEAVDKGLHRILKKPDIRPSVRKAIKRILKKWDLLEEPKEWDC